MTVLLNSKRWWPVLVFAGLLIGTSAARADHSHRQSVEYIYARVVDVEPIYVQYREPHSHQCLKRKYRHRYQHYRSLVPRRHSSHETEVVSTIAGGVLGAAIGNGLGHDRASRQFGRLAGGILGAALGHELAAHAHHEDYRHYDCVSDKSYSRVEAYRVTYRYKGQHYQTRTRFHPGRKIKLRLEMTPVS